MKLYTEEQLRKVFLKAQTLDDNGNRLYDFFDEIKHDGDLTPIELPSDEEIKKEMKFDWLDHEDVAQLGGAIWMRNWMRDKIQGGNK